MLAPLLHAQLQSAAASVYEQASASLSQFTAAEATAIVAEIQSTVKASLASILLDYNRKHALPMLSLPNELWAKIWAHLPWEDCTSVSQVCTDWRTISLGTPALWTTSTFVSRRHGNGCSCRLCRKPSPPASCPECGRVRPTSGANTLDRVIAFLDRSGALPIDVDLRISAPEGAEATPVLQLADILKPHADRLISLNTCADDMDVLEQFLAQFPELPALHRLHVALQWSENNTLNVVQPLALPALHELVLHHQIDVGDEFHLSCPSVRSLTASFCSIWQLQRLFLACPSVQVLDLRVGASTVDAGSPDDLEKFHSLLSGLPIRSLRIRNAFKVDMLHLASLFSQHLPPIFELGLTGSKGAVPEHFQFVFHDADAPVSLECVLVDELPRVRLSLKRTAAAGVAEFSRAMILDRGTLKDSVLNTFWSCLDRSAIDTLTSIRVDSTLWHIICDIDKLPRPLLIRTVFIEFTRAECVGAWARNEPHPGLDNPWIHVEELILVARVSSSEQVSMQGDLETATALRDLFGLRTGARVQKLRLQCIELADDATVLKELFASDVTTEESS